MRRQVLDHPGFRRRRLEAEAGGPGVGLKIFVDGTLIKSDRGVWKLVDDRGASLEAKAASAGFSLATTLTVGTAIFTLQAPLNLAEYALAALPLALVAVGGAIGGGLGAAAAALNVRLLSSGLPSPLRYGGAVATTILAVAVWMAAVTALRGAR